MEEFTSTKYIKLAFELQADRHYKNAIEMLYKALAIECENTEIISQIAHLYSLLNNKDRAIEMWTKVLELDKDNIFAKTNLAKMYESIGKTDRALKLSEEIFAQKKDSESFATYLKSLFVSKQYQKVIDEYLQSDFQKNSSNEMFLVVAEACLKLDNADEAKKYLTSALDNDDNDCKALFILAEIEFKEHKIESAKLRVEKAVQIEPSEAFYNLLGLINLQQNNVTEATNDFVNAINLNRSNPEYCYNLATAYVLCGWLFEAKKNFQKAVLLDPSNLDYKYALAQLYYANNELSKAQEEISQIKKSKQDYIDAKILEAMVNSKLGHVLIAKKQLLTYLEQNSENDYIYYGLGKIYKDLYDYSKSVEYFQNAVKLKPYSLEYLSELADSYVENKEYENAEKTIIEIIKINKHYVFAHILLAKIYVQFKEYGKALQSCENAINLDANSNYTYYLKSKILKRLGDSHAALENLKIAITLSADNHKYYGEVAKIYFEKNNFNDAILYYKEASELDITNIDYKYGIALCAGQLNDYKTANHYFSLARRLEPDNAAILCDYMELLYKMGKRKNAVKMLKEVSKLTNNNSLKQILKDKTTELDEKYPESKCFWGCFWTRK